MLQHRKVTVLFTFQDAYKWRLFFEIVKVFWKISFVLDLSYRLTFFYREVPYGKFCRSLGSFWYFAKGLCRGLYIIFHFAIEEFIFFFAMPKTNQNNSQDTSQNTSYNTIQNTPYEALPKAGKNSICPIWNGAGEWMASAFSWDGIFCCDFPIKPEPPNKLFKTENREICD